MNFEGSLQAKHRNRYLQFEDLHNSQLRIYFSTSSWKMWDRNFFSAFSEFEKFRRIFSRPEIRRKIFPAPICSSDANLKKLTFKPPPRFPAELFYNQPFHQNFYHFYPVANCLDDWLPESVILSIGTRPLFLKWNFRSAQ